MEAFCVQGVFEWTRWQACIANVLDGLEQVFKKTDTRPLCFALPRAKASGWHAKA